MESGDTCGLRKKQIGPSGRRGWPMTQKQFAGGTGGLSDRRFPKWPFRAMIVVGLTATVAGAYRLRNTFTPNSGTPEGTADSDPSVAGSLDVRTRLLLLVTRLLPAPAVLWLTGLLSRLSRRRQDPMLTGDIAHDG